MSTQPLNIVIVLFPGVTHLDFTGPHQFFARIPKVNLMVASLGGAKIIADKLSFSDLEPLERIASCDLLCIPGGFGVADMIHEGEFMSHIQRLGNTAKYISSICTGSIILAAAGLLEGKNAACHWAWRDVLGQFPNVTVKTDRVVRDGNIFTGGGVTAGIDMALTVIAELLGDEHAQAIQLGLEYDPKPPFIGGRPENSPPQVLNLVNMGLKQKLADKQVLVERFLTEQNAVQI